MNERIKRGLDLLKPGSIIGCDVKTVADLYEALKHVVEQNKVLIEMYLAKDDTCPICRQGAMTLTGAGFHWMCTTCGHTEKVEQEEL